MTANQSLQPTANPLRGLSEAELVRKEIEDAEARASQHFGDVPA